MYVLDLLTTAQGLQFRDCRATLKNNQRTMKGNINQTMPRVDLLNLCSPADPKPETTQIKLSFRVCHESKTGSELNNLTFSVESEQRFME